MLPTPDLSHISEETYLQVYEPAGFSPIVLMTEDSFILLDALENEIPLLRQTSSEILARGNLPLVIEVGSGSGCISAFLQKEIYLPFQCCIC
jgi:release factor glutamine methyltransferase